MDENDLETLLHTDPLYEAEKITGESYKTSDLTNSLGWTIMSNVNKQKNKLLIDRDDTTHGDSLDRYQRIIRNYGFQEVLHIPFTKLDPWDKLQEDHFFIYWHDDGLFLSFDTYRGTRVNGGKVSYNWRPLSNDYPWNITASSSWRGDVMIGSHDCREALIFNLENLRKYGEFVNPWIRSDFLWLKHHGDDKDADYKEINKERIAMLPDQVQSAIVGLCEL